MVEKLRAVKDDGEVATMREAALLISEVFEDALPSIKPGISELELAGYIGTRHEAAGGLGAVL